MKRGEAAFDRRRSAPLLGLFLGLTMAFGLALIAGVILVLDGPQRFESNGVTFVQALALYFAAGALGGPIFGLLLPLTVHRAGAVVVGAIVALPAYLGAALLMDARLSSGLIPAVLVGSAVGFVLWAPITPVDDDGDDGEEKGRGAAP